MTRPATLPSCGCTAPCRCDCVGGSGLPWPVANPSGLSTLSYRVGDFLSFRHALVLHRAGETELADWQPATTTGDLGLQMVDWWAYLADILTFYNERAANQAYLGTADLPESPGRLVAVLGYRPRPGIGSVVSVAALANRPAPLVLPAGFAASSKATPTVPSQVFELADRSSFMAPTSVAGPPPDTLRRTVSAGGPPSGAPPGAGEVPSHPQLVANGGVLVTGTPSKVAVGDRLVLLAKAFATGDTRAAVVTVAALVPETDPHGTTNTRVQLVEAATLGSLANGAAADFSLLRATRADHLATLPSGAEVVGSGSLVLAAPARYLTTGQALVVETTGAGGGSGAAYSNNPSTGYAVVGLTAYAEALWYANAPSAASPGTPPATPVVGVPLVVATLTVAPPGGADLSGTFAGQPGNVVVRSGWADLGVLLGTPVTQCASLPTTLTLAAAPSAPAGSSTPALVVGADGKGTAVNAIPQPGTTQVTLDPAAPGSLSQGTPGTPGGPALVPPLQLLWDLVTLTRGQSVRAEVLGTGNATAAGQEFTLSRSPVTYLTDLASLSGTGYSSTVTLWVNGVRWREVPSFFGTGPADRVFTTHEDTAGKTHVTTGDGVLGARLSTGAAVSADYRVGSGAAVPAPGTLNVVKTPVPNLRGLANPVSPTGGADPDDPARIVTLAPASVLTFGRAVSADDYAVVALQAPGVTRAAAVYAWDPGSQRPEVTVYVGDDDGAVTSAQAVLASEADPNRPVSVLAAVRRRCSLRLGLVIDPTAQPSAVLAAATTALLDTQEGLFAPGVLGLGEVLYRSRIEEAVLVPGALAVHRLRMRIARPGMAPLHSAGPRFNPGPGGWFDLPAANLHLSTVVSGSSGG